MGLCCPSNIVGVGGKGLALQFKMKYPEAFESYRKACKDGKMDIGKVYIKLIERLHDCQYIVYFPTKKHWKNPSCLNFIEKGLDDLAYRLEEYNIRSLAMCRLGSGLGGLDWNEVKPLIIAKLEHIEDLRVVIYEQIH
jgi:O-acetyl-ADP-ribose deacetylase (regulator of RNase III)